MLDRCGVAGVMRRWVLEQAKDLGLRPLEGRLRWEEFGEAEEVFMTNAVAGVVSVGVVQNGAASAFASLARTARALCARAWRLCEAHGASLVALVLLLLAAAGGALLARAREPR